MLLILTSRENLGTPRGGTTNKYPPYPLVPPAQISVLTLVPPNPRVLKTGTKNRYLKQVLKIGLWLWLGLGFPRSGFGFK